MSSYFIHDGYVSTTWGGTSNNEFTWEYYLDPYGRIRTRVKRELTQEDKFKKSYMEL